MHAFRARPLTSLYVAGPFSMGYADLYTFLMPLYALSLGFDAAEVVVLAGARSIVAMFLAIHIGALMDCFGTRRVTLFFVLTSMALAPVFSLVPWYGCLLLLQLVNGASVSFAWSGAQTLIAQLAEGEARYSRPGSKATVSTPADCRVSWNPADACWRALVQKAVAVEGIQIG
jgi:MFS family permease